MRVKFGNKIYESEQIIYLGGMGNMLYVAYPKGSYEVVCSTEELAKSLFEQVFTNGYVDFNREDVDYDSSWDWKIK